MAKGKPNGNIHPTRFFVESQDLYELFEDYKFARKEEATQWPKVQYVGKDGHRVEDYPPMPLTFEGFKSFAYNKKGTIQQYFENKDGLYNNFVEVCSRIKNEIRENQITGGLLGFYNPSITQRLNSLTEKVENTNIEQPLFPDAK